MTEPDESNGAHAHFPPVPRLLLQITPTAGWSKAMELSPHAAQGRPGLIRPGPTHLQNSLVNARRNTLPIVSNRPCLVWRFWIAPPETEVPRSVGSRSNMLFTIKLSLDSACPVLNLTDKAPSK